MTIKETKLRIDPDLDQWLTSQSAIAGIAKTKYITQVLESHRVNAAHTHPQQSPKVSPNVSPSSSDLVTRIAAMEVRLTKVENSTPGTIPKTIPSDTTKFYKGQEITAQSSKLYNLVWDSIEVKQILGKSKYYLSNKLGIICQVAGVSRGGKTKLEVWNTFPGDPVVLNSDGTFLTVKDGGIQWFTESELALLAEPSEPITPIEVPKDEIAIEAPIEEPKPSKIGATVNPEVSNDEIPIEATKEAPTPINEAVVKARLTSQEFAAMYGWVTSGKEYSSACSASSAGGYTDANGDTWVYVKGHNKGWIKQTTKQLEISLGVQ